MTGVPEPGVPGRGTPLRLLLVEDSENDAMLLLRELRRGGYEPVHERVYTPEDMERALGGAADRGEPHEVVVSDYYMPRFRAPDALLLLRGLGYDAPFIVVSGKIGEDAAVGVMKAGANDYLTKENMARLCPAIERELKEAEVRRERARAEEALARSEIRFKRLVEQAADAMFVHDLQGRFVDVNRRACESLGYSREELLGMSVSDVEVGHDPGSLRGLWDEISSGAPRTLEGTHRRGDGTTFPVEVRVGMFEGGGSPLVLALARDVTGRKKAEKQARETEVRYQTLVEQVPAVTYVQEPFGDKRVTYVSPQVESVLGYPADRKILDPDHWLNIMHPEDRERVLAEDERTDRTGEPFKAEYRQFAGDGSTVWIRDEATLVRDEEGRPIYWQGVQYDITDQKLAEEELRRSEERYRTFIEQSAEGIWRFELETPMPTDLPEDEQLDHFYRYAYLAECNDVMARMYGFGDASGPVGARVGDLLPRSKPGNLEYLRAAFRAGYRLKDGESRETDRHGNERVIVNGLSGVVEGGRLVRVWGTQRDVTEQKEAEEQLARLASFPELNPNPIVETSLTGGPTYLNPAAQARFPDLRELGPRHPALADLKEVNRRIWSAGGRPFVREVRVGDSFHQQAISRTPEGELLRIYGVDVTERRRAEDALRKSEERFRSLVQNASDIVLVLAEDGEILYESPAVRRILGFTPEERVGLNVFDLIHPEDRARVARVFREHGGSPGPFPPVEYRVRDKWGSWRHLEAIGENLLHDPVIGGIVVNSRDVTERRRTEEALRESEERYRTLFTFIDEGFCLCELVLDDDGRPADYRFLDVNPKFEEMTGLADAAGKTAGELVPGLEGRWVETYGRVGLGGETLRFEDGSEAMGRWFDVYASPVEPKGSGRFTVVFKDVTERKRAEEALRLSEERASLALDVARLGTWNWEPARDEILADARAREICGLDPDAPLSLADVMPLIHPDDRSRIEAALGAAMQPDGEGRYTEEFRFVHPDGAMRWVISRGRALFEGELRRPALLLGTVLDITERKRSEESLRQSEGLYRSVVEQAAENIFLVDIETTRVLEANAALSRSLGYRGEELEAMTLYDIVAHDRQSVDENTRRVVEERRLSLGERRYRRKDGSLADVEVNVSVVPYNGRQAMCIVAHDITGRKQAEQALGEIREAERGRIARELHDSILQDIVYALQEIQILQITGPYDSALGGAAEALRRSVEGLRGAIFDLRLRGTLGRSFVSSLENLVDLNRRMARGAYELDLVVGEGVSRGIPEERGRELVRIVQEALTNVRRHAGARRARVELGVEGDDLYVWISDDGCGFDPEGSRVGMGRHSMRQRALDLGGELELRSEPGRGTRVRCRVPLSRLAGEGRPGGGIPGTKKSGKGPETRL